MVEIAKLIDFDKISEYETFQEKIDTLKAIKNELIGSSETKQDYFDQGLIETVVPLLQKEKN